MRRYNGNRFQWTLATRFSWLSFMVGCFGIIGCTVSARVTPTVRSSIEQRLVARSLERAVEQLPLERFAGKHVHVNLFSLGADQTYAKEFVTAQLQVRGATVVAEWQKADLFLKVFAPVLGIDQGQTLVGLPSFVMPMVGVAVPDIAVYKAVRNRGQTEVEVYAFDSQTGELVDQLAVRSGQAKYDQYTLFIVISFTWSDLEEPPSDEEDRGWRVSARRFSME